MWSVIGHDAVVRTLDRSVETGRLAHAYLFLGPQAVGKRLLALDLACKLNCVDGDERGRGRIMRSVHPDVQTIGVLDSDEGPRRKEISIDQIKELQQAAGLQPYEARYRVFIIDGAEQLSDAAANCLLKTLEEPPASVVLVLLASDEQAVLPTILSRCRTYRLRPVDRDVIAEALTSRYDVAPDRARLLASCADGAMGWAIAAAKDEGLAEARAARVETVLGLPGVSFHERLALSGRLAEEYTRRREDVFHWLDLWRQSWRDVLLIKGGRETSVVNADRLDALRGLAAGCSLQEIAGVLRQGQATSERLERNANPRLALDVLMLSVPAASPVAAAVS